jgi:subtilisin-like proprotein convertase family protein
MRDTPILALVLLLFGVPGDGARAATSTMLPAAGEPVDARWSADHDTDINFSRQAEMRQAGASLLPGASIQWSPSTGTPAAVHDARGPLTHAADVRASAAIVRDFLDSHRRLYGLDQYDLDRIVVLGDSPGGASGLRLLRVEQRVDGWPVFDSETRFLLDRGGRIWRSLGTLLPGLATSPVAFDRAALLAPDVALDALLRTTGVALDRSAVSIRNATAVSAILEAPAPLTAPASARLVWFPLGPGHLVPAWSLTAFTDGGADWYALIDALNGELLWRRNLREQASNHAARFSVYVVGDGRTPADSPAPGSPNQVQPGDGTQFPAIARSIVNMHDVQDPAASPNGWIDDCPGGADRCDTTTGNNVLACLDRVAPEDSCDAALDLSGRPQGNPDSAARSRDFLGAVPRDFGYTPAPLSANPDAGDAPTNAAAQRGALVQAFYLINWYHDRLYALGFDEASGNFQQLNLHSQGGLGGDRVAVDVQNAGATGSSTPADGAGPLRLQLGIATGPTPDRDLALDADILFHELTHGLTHRLVGNSTGLLWDAARAMGEGWSDFYALALLNGTNADDPHGSYAFGAWHTYRTSAQTDNYIYGVRRFPYSTDLARNPLTWADVDAVTADPAGGIAPNPLNIGRFGAMEVHNAGSIWALTLWEIRARIIDDPSGAGGDVPSGNQTMLQLVTDALKMTPSNPGFLDGREALLAADCATNDCANEGSIWAGFAERGLGYGAVAPLATLGRFAVSHMSIGTSDALPHLDVVDAADVLIADAPAGNGDGRIDPGESVNLSVPLFNPWRGAGRSATGTTATLSSTTPGVVILQGAASYPAIAPLATGVNGAAFQVALGPGLACGQRIGFELQTQSSLGNHSTHFDLRLGTPAGTAAPMTFSATPELAIPISSVDGVSSTLLIAADHEIADLDLRIDSLSFPVTGHLSVLLRSPAGYGIDLIFKRGGLLTPNQGGGADFVGLTIDDDLPRIAAEDLNQSLSTQAPFTGNWLPAFNSPFWDSHRPSPPDPPAPVFSDSTGHLQRLDGTGSAGTWTINVANGSAMQSGTLHNWSLVATPRAWQCTPYVVDGVFADGFEGS